MSKTKGKKNARAKSSNEGWKGKAPNRGQWKQNPSLQMGEKIGFAVVSVKLRPAEKEEFRALCKTLGVSPNWAMRSMTRQASGFLEVHEKGLDDLKSITRQISGIATNINQIAKAGNRTLSPDYQAFMEDRRALGKQLASIELLMQQVLNVGKRRSDGLARLKQAVDAV